MDVDEDEGNPARENNHSVTKYDDSRVSAVEYCDNENLH